MFILIRLIGESFRFAWNALAENLLRTLLSLLGVTIGIFSIIAILTAVEGLDGGIKKSLSFLGDKVVYVEKWPWSFGATYPWWKYYQRPEVNSEEHIFLQDNMEWASAVSIFAVRGRITLKNGSNSVSSVVALGVSHEHNQVSNLALSDGRYFTPAESDRGAYVALIGVNIAEDLYPEGNPVGKTLKLKGISFKVIGLLQRQGENLLGAPSNDGAVVIPYKALAKLFSSGERGISPKIAIKGLPEDPDLTQAESEIRSLMRRYRQLKPKEEDSFAINRTDMIASVVDNITGVLGFAGSVIAFFSILIGGFGIANIMFVSVKERTNIIGIQKSLGAKNYFILLQFLLEAMFLSIFGGVFGLGCVFLLELIPTGESFELNLSFANLVKGIVISSAIGIVSGIIPAIQASRMDPVEAIRSN